MKERKNKHTEDLSEKITTGACILLVQQITTWWTKTSRGAERATLRSAVPQALSLPTAQPSVLEPTALFHKVRYAENNDFRIPYNSTVSTKPFHHTLHGDNIALSRTRSVAQVHLRWTFGAPMRHSINDILTLAPGEWGRVCFNYRMGGGWDASWSYSLWVFNIGLFFTFTPDIFQVTEPKKIYSNLADLW